MHLMAHGVRVCVCVCWEQSKLLRRVDHENIVHLVDSFVEDNALYLVMEMAEGGDLATRIKKQGTTYARGRLAMGARARANAQLTVVWSL